MHGQGRLPAEATVGRDRTNGGGPLMDRAPGSSPDFAKREAPYVQNSRE